MSEHKPLNFRGSALADLRAFPATVRQEVGYQLDKVQRAGLEPKDWKPMATVRGPRRAGNSHQRR